VTADAAGYLARFAGVSVAGRGVVQVVPDIATFRLAVTATADTAGDAMSQASTAMEAMVAAAASAGVAPADRQTDGMHLRPWQGRKGAPPRHRATQQLSLRVRDVGAAGEVLVQVLAAGGDRAEVESSWLGLSEEQAPTDQARDLAMADARHRAEQLGRLAGRPLGAVLAVHEDIGTTTAGPHRKGGYLGGGTVALAASSSPPVEAGQIEVTVVLSVEFAWGD
jgi:uncharacterized protein